MSPIPRDLLSGLLAALMGSRPAVDPTARTRRPGRRKRRRVRARNRSKRVNHWLDLAYRRAREQAPPAAGYCRGKLARENEVRRLRGQNPIDYPESQYVGPKAKAARLARKRARRADRRAHRGR